MTIPKINSAHGSDTRNIINAAIDSLNAQGKSIQDLVAKGQLTPAQYVQLIAAINDTVKKSETGVFNLNIFDEPTRNLLLGLDEGSINAVLGEGNVKTENLSSELFQKISELNSVVFKKEIKNPYYLKGKPSSHGKITLEFLFDTDGMALEQYAAFDINFKYYTESENASVIHIGMYQNNSSTPGEFAGGTGIAEEIDNPMIINKEKEVDVSLLANNNDFRYKHFFVEVELSDRTIISDFYVGNLEISVNGKVLDRLIHVGGHRMADGYELEPKWHDFYADLRGMNTIAEDIKMLKDTIITTNQTRFNGLKVNFLGDSITDPARAYKKYFEFLEEELNLSAVRPYGISSSTIASPSNAQSYRPMCDRYTEMDNDADLIIVFGGTNDYGFSNANMGEMFNSDGTPNKNKTTFYGGCHVLFEGLIKKYTNRKSDILILTPLPRQGITAPNPTTGLLLKDYADVIKEVAAFYSLPVLDLYSTSGLQSNIPEVKTKYVPDGTHPNTDGHEIISNRIIGALKSI